jgi:hypothetical protein
MDSAGAPVGQLLSSLPLEERIERYRQFAAQFVAKALEESDADRRAEYIAMAAGWHSMAQEAERYLAPGFPPEDEPAESIISKPT